MQQPHGSSVNIKWMIYFRYIAVFEKYWHTYILTFAAMKYLEVSYFATSTWVARQLLWFALIRLLGLTRIRIGKVVWTKSKIYTKLTETHINCWRNCEVDKIFQLWQLVCSHCLQERGDIEGKDGRRRRRGEEEKVQDRGEEFARRRKKERVRRLGCMMKPPRALLPSLCNTATNWSHFQSALNFNDGHSLWLRGKWI